MRSIEFSNISFFQMQLCISILEHGSFTRAANACHVTQPTLSKKISELENKLGLLLFIRGKNTTVRPTPAGKIIFAEWKSILKQMELSIQKAYNAQACLGVSIILSSIPSADVDLYITPLINEYLLKHPETEFRFESRTSSDQANGLINGELDIAFVPLLRKNLFNGAPLVSNQILSCHWYVGMRPSNPLADKKNVTFEDLRTQRFVTASPQLFPHYYEFVEESCARHGFIPQVSFCTNNHISVPMNVRASDEVCIVDGVSSVLGDSSLVFRQLPGVESGVIMSINENNTNPIAVSFHSFAKDYYKSKGPQLAMSS